MSVVNNSYNIPKTIAELKNQLEGWEHNLTNLYGAFDQKVLNPLNHDISSLEKISKGLTLTSEIVQCQLNLADPDKDTVLIKDLQDMQTTLGKTSEVFKKVSKSCAAAQINALETKLNEALQDKNLNTKEGVLRDLKRSFTLHQTNPLFKSEEKRIPAFLETIEKELQQLSGERAKKAKLLEEISSSHAIVKEAKNVASLTVIPKEVQNELKPILFSKFYPEQKAFMHLNILDGRFTLEQIKTAFEILQDDNSPGEITELQPTKQPVVHLIENIASDSLDIIPDEIVFRIFQLLGLKDFLSLAHTNLRLHAISQIPSACQSNLNGRIHDFLLESRDPFIQSMPRFELINLSRELENKLVSKDPFPVVLTKNFNRSPTSIDSFPVPKIVINNILVLSGHTHEEPGSTGTILLCDLQTGKEIQIAAHESRVTTLVPVNAESPMLVTATPSEVKIWDFEKLTTSPKEAVIWQDTTPKFAVSNLSNPSIFCSIYSTVIAASEDYLAIGYPDHVLLFDISHGISPNNTIKIPNTKLQQIILNDSEIALVNANDISIWGMDKIKSALRKKESLKLENSFKMDIVSPRFVKIIDDKIFVAQKQYSSLYGYSITGFLYDKKTGNELKTITHPLGRRNSGLINAAATSENLLFTGGDAIKVWDMDSTDESPVDELVNFWEGTVHKAYSMGKHVLFAHNAGYTILKKQAAIKCVGHRDKEMNSIVSSKYYDGTNHTFDIFGKYLVIESHEEFFESEGESLERKKVTVYKLV